MLDRLITRSTLKNLAGATAFARGEDYYTSGLVGDVRDAGDTISARVEGSESYRVKLWDEKGTSLRLHLPARGGRLFLQALCGGWPRLA